MRPRIIRGPTKSKDWCALIQCLACDRKAWIDREQYEGAVSIVCECGWHETHDLREENPDESD